MISLNFANQYVFILWQYPLRLDMLFKVSILSQALAVSAEAWHAIHILNQA